MQAIMLAAGMGKRLGKHTGANTKCMLRVAGQTLLERAVGALKEAGITKLVLVTGYQSENLRSYVAQHIHGMDIEYVDNPSYATTNNIYSLWLARNYLVRDDTILLESDLIYEPGVIRELVEYGAPDVAVVAHYEQWMEGTVTLLDAQDRIVEFVEKKNFAFDRAQDYYKTVNIYKFSREFSQQHYLPFLNAYIEAYGPSEYYELVLKAIAHLAHSGLKAFKLTGQKWYEIDDAQDLDIAESLFASEQNRLPRYQQRYGGYWRFSGLLDFCYLVNPYFPPAELIEKLKYYFTPLLIQYPSGLYVQNINAARMYGVDESEILVGNGAAELIGALGRLTQGVVALSVPTFNEYMRCFAAGSFAKIDTKQIGYRLNRDLLIQAAAAADTVVIVNPDNPSGAILGEQDMLEILEYCRGRQKRVVVDESFMDFAEPDVRYSLMDSKILQEYPNLVVVRSISKSYGVPGLRLGVLATGDPSLREAMSHSLPVWNINSFAEYFLQIYPPFQKQYHAACDRMRAGRARFQEWLSRLPHIQVYPSQANYFLCQLGGGLSATELASRLLSQYQILVKDLTGKEGFEQGEFVRLAIRDDEDNQRLYRALQEIL